MSVPFLQTSPFWVDPLRRIDATLPLNSLPSLTPPPTASRRRLRIALALPKRSLGNAFHWRPVRSTYTMVSTTAGQVSAVVSHSAHVDIFPRRRSTLRNQWLRPTPERIGHPAGFRFLLGQTVAPTPHSLATSNDEPPPHFDRRRLSATGNIGAHNTPATTTKNTAQRLHAPFFNRPKRHCRHKLKHGP